LNVVLLIAASSAGDIAPNGRDDRIFSGRKRRRLELNTRMRRCPSAVLREQPFWVRCSS
jgi:hypothetical protein